MTRTHADMRIDALIWLDGDASFPRDKALGEQHLALDVLELVTALETAERSRDAWEVDALRYAKNAEYWREQTDAMRREWAFACEERDRLRALLGEVVRIALRCVPAPSPLTDQYTAIEHNTGGVVTITKPFANWERLQEIAKEANLDA